MGNKLESLKTIFSNKIFRIPDYQRGYAWDKSQLDDFWQDLHNLKGDKIHYTGLLTVEAVSKKRAESLEQWEETLPLMRDDHEAYYVIDGQQRLTTSIILVNELLSGLKKGETINEETREHWQRKFLYRRYGEGYLSYIFGYERDNPSDEYFKTKILGQTSMSADKVPENTLYTKNLEAAKDYFREVLNLLSKEEKQLLFKRLINRFKFNFYEIDDELDVYVTFETMNNRGKPLSNLELLKNRLIYLSTLLETDEDSRKRLRKNINEAWKTIYEYLGKNHKRKMPDDDFLKNHWIMYYQYNRKESDVYAKFLLNKVFSADRVNAGDLRAAEIQNYLDSLATAVKYWFYIHNPTFSSFGSETKEWLQKLNRIGMRAFPPMLMAMMIYGSEEALLKLTKAAERFLFLVFLVSQRPSHTKNSEIYRMANNFYQSKGNMEADDIIDQVRLLTNGGNITYMDGLFKHISTTVHYHAWSDVTRFKNHIEDLFRRGKGFYKWSGLPYFLFEYELMLESRAVGDEKMKWAMIAGRKREDSIEHIYPQTPKEDCWKRDYEQFDDEQRKMLLHSLGNLVLLKGSKNSELSNRCFSYKKRHPSEDGEKGYYNGSYSEIEVASYDDWTPAEINGRGIKLLKFMEERWGIDFAEKGIEYRDLLQLDFLYKGE